MLLQSEEIVERDLMDYQPKSGTKLAYDYAVSRRLTVYNTLILSLLCNKISNTTNNITKVNLRLNRKLTLTFLSF